MGKIVLRHQPCIDQVKCCSSDARQIYEDGGSFCFSCGRVFPKDLGALSKVKEVKEVEAKLTLDQVKTYPIRGFPERKITKAVCEFFEVRVGVDSDNQTETHYYPYGSKEIKGYKERTLPKAFMWVGKSGGLFGQSKFNGGGKRLIITEGEIDALSVAQASMDRYKKVYPVISLPSSTGTDQLIESREWIRSFAEVVLCFDNDEAGDKAVAKAIKIIGTDKVKIAKYPTGCKDQNDVLLKHGSESVNQSVWDAQPYCPAGIIAKEDIWKQMVERKNIPCIPYPPCLEGVNTKIKGMRTGEIALFISGTGSGKSSLMREIVLHLSENSPDKIGVIFLEESPGETGIKLSGMAINRNPANEEISDEDLRVGFDKVFGNDKIVLLDHQGSIKDSSIIDKLEYMCLVGCTHIIVDHITILVSEGAEGLTGNEAIDYIMNCFLTLVKKHPVWIGLISHLRKVGVGGTSFEEGKMPTMDDIRGSGSIKQISFDIIAFARNMGAEEENVRNSVAMSVLKSRTIGLTGPVKGALYNHATGRLVGLDCAPEEFFEVA